MPKAIIVDGNHKATPFFTKNTFLSNFFSCQIRINDVTYNSTEQFYQHKKALFYEDLVAAEKILRTSNPAKIKHISKTIIDRRARKNEQWYAREAYESLLEANIAKYTQNPQLKAALLQTEGWLIEASPTDSYWGIGLSDTDQRIRQSKFWGKNRFGFLLTSVRDQLKELEQIQR